MLASLGLIFVNVFLMTLDGARKLAAAIGQGFDPVLLDGVTGSGKTEVYFEAVAEAVDLCLFDESGAPVRMLGATLDTTSFVDALRARVREDRRNPAGTDGRELGNRKTSLSEQRVPIWCHVLGL